MAWYWESLPLTEVQALCHKLSNQQHVRLPHASDSMSDCNKRNYNSIVITANSMSHCHIEELAFTGPAPLLLDQQHNNINVSMHFTEM